MSRKDYTEDELRDFFISYFCNDKKIHKEVPVFSRSVDLVQYDNENWEDILEGDLVDFVYHEVEDGRMLLTKVLNRHKETLS